MEKNSRTFVRAFMAQTSYLVLHRPLIKRLGLVEAILLSLFIDRETVLCKEENNDGWFFLLANYIQDSLNLGRRPIDAGIRSLEETHLIESEIRGIPPKKFYRLCWDNISMMIETLPDDSDSSNLYKMHKLSCTERTNYNVQNAQLINKNNNKEEYIPPTCINIQASPKGEDVVERRLFDDDASLEQRNREAIEKAIQELDDSFEVFWTAYDKKCGKAQAYGLWKKLSKTDRKAVMDFVPRYIAATPDRQYRMNPTTLLNPNRKRWEDEIINSNNNGNNAGNSILSTNVERIKKGSDYFLDFFDTGRTKRH